MMMMLALIAALAACAPRPEPAEPALWRVDGPGGERAWLFGTIHALHRPAAWRSAAVDDAFAKADRVVVEVGTLVDDTAMARVFAGLATSPGHPPLSDRVSPRLRGKLDELLARAGMSSGQFASTETWAAALMLARVEDRDLDKNYGIDRAVIAAAGKARKRLVELEGAEGQLGIFDRLPEREQRDLLDLVVGDSGAADGESAALADTWRRGDMKAIEKETRRGLLADPELREALFTDRNRAWTDRIVTMLQRGNHPFVAVGTAHMAGPDGLPAMLEARGYRVTRLQ
jgi:uncharacterized protein YbaP (TraB family)